MKGKYFFLTFLLIELSAYAMEKPQEAPKAESLQQPAQPIAEAATPAPSYAETAISYLWTPITGLQTAGGYMWQAGQSVSSWVSCAAQHYPATFAMRQEIAQPDSHSYLSAQIDVSPSEEEKSFLEIRRPRTKDALEKVLNLKIADQDLPSVGICFSGGGYRAMLESLGWLLGAEKLGIVDTASYITALSGSTWGLNPWIASGMKLETYKNQLIPRLIKSVQQHVKSMSDEDIKAILITLGKRYYSNQTLGPVDLFGAILAHMLLQGHVENPYLFPLSALAQKIKTGNYPLPISTAVLGGLPFAQEGIRPTFEFTPFVTSSFGLNVSLPMWALGRLFKNGTTMPVTPADLFVGEKKTLGYLGTLAAPFTSGYVAPEKGALALAAFSAYTTPVHEQPFYGTELSLGYLMATCGSAFAVDMNNVILELYKRLLPESCPKETKTMHDILEVVKNMMSSHLAGLGAKVNLLSTETSKDLEAYLKNEHYGAARLPNIAAGLPNNPIAERTEIGLVDGGFGLVNNDRLNIAIMPLLYRKTNLILICDSSWDLKGAPSLRAAEEAARRLKLKFPKIDYSAIDTTIASVFIDKKDLECPIIVYMPGIGNQEYDKSFDPVTAEFADTFNFQYTSEQSQQLMGLFEFNVLQSKDILIKAFAQAAERKKQLEQKRRGWLGLGALYSWVMGKN